MRPVIKLPADFYAGDRAQKYSVSHGKETSVISMVVNVRLLCSTKCTHAIIVYRMPAGVCIHGNGVVEIGLSISNRSTVLFPEL